MFNYEQYDINNYNYNNNHNNIKPMKTSKDYDEQAYDEQNDIEQANIESQDNTRITGRYIRSITKDTQFGKYGNARETKSIILHFIFFWTVYNSLVQNKTVFIYGVYWVRISATKLMENIDNLRNLRTIKAALKELVDMKFLDVIKGKGGSAKGCNCYRPSMKFIEHLEKSKEMSSLLYEVGSFYNYKTHKEYNTDNMLNNLKQQIKTTDNV